MDAVTQTAYRFDPDLPPEWRGFGDRAVDERKRLASRLARHIASWESSIDGIKERWKRNEALYRNDPSAVSVTVSPAMPTIPMPLWAQRADRIVSEVFDSITQIQPYIRAVTNDVDFKAFSIQIERDLHFLALKSGVDAALWRALKVAVNTGISGIKVSFDPDAALFRFTVAHPADWIVYPHEVDQLSDLVTCGARTTMTRLRLRQMVADGEVMDVPVAPERRTDDPAGRSVAFDRTEPSRPDSDDDEIVELFELEHRYWDERQRRIRVLRCLLAPETEEILHLEVLPYSDLRWLDVRFDVEYGQFIPASSPGQTAQGLQTMFTWIVNTIVQGATATAFPPLAVRGGTFESSKVNYYGPGAIITTQDGPKDAAVLPINFNGEYLVRLIDVIQSITDGATRVSTTNLGVQTPGSRTATEIANMMESGSKGVAAYANHVSRGVEQLWAVLYDMFRTHFPLIKDRWQGQIQTELDQFDAMSTLDLGWECSSRTGATNPASLVMKYQKILELSMDPRAGIDVVAVVKDFVQSLSLPRPERYFLPDQATAPAQIEAIVSNLVASGMGVDQVASMLADIVEQLTVSQTGAVDSNGGAGGPVQPISEFPVGSQGLARDGRMGGFVRVSGPEAVVSAQGLVQD